VLTRLLRKYVAAKLSKENSASGRWQSRIAARSLLTCRLSDGRYLAHPEPLKWLESSYSDREKPGPGL
jgi:hypothetical protein